jgi:8-hydroxy-5-deazaflavin:NADPH oxidoreductase
MRIGIIGSSMVAQTLGGRLLELGHEVMVSARDPQAAKDLGQRGALPSAVDWATAHKGQGRNAAAGGFADAAAFGELLINATAGASSLDALGAADRADIEGKILVDVANALDFSRGFPPGLAISNYDSLGERIQAAYPGAKVVKTLNTVTVAVMIDPAQLSEETHVFVAGNDAAAKSWVSDNVLRAWFGWRQVIDLGDITAARGTEMYLPLWLRLMGTTGTALLNVRVVVAGR